MTNAAHARHSAEIDTTCEGAFCSLIAQRTGIVLQDHQLHNLRDTVRRGCERFEYRNAAQYLDTLQQSQSLTAPLEYLIAGVTVGESYFFRDSEQIELLRGKLLPDMIFAKRTSGDLSLRVWSAGCSQGQEIYTIALLLQELIADIDQWRIHLLGTDINSEAVASAIRGIYSDWSFRATPVDIRDRWFAKVGEEYEIRQQIKNMVRFAYLNLAVDAYPSILSETNALDLILCRNVFIYLDRQAVQRSMAQYAQCLLDQGVLILGASDPLEYKHTGLELVQTNSVGYFLKNGAPGAVLTAGREQVAAYPPVGKSGEAWLRDACVKEKVLPRSRASHSNLPGHSPVKAAPFSSRGVPATENPLATESQDKVDMVGIMKLFNDSNWDDVLAQIESACQQGMENSELWQIKAKVLANLGRTELALQACERSLALDPVNKHAYLIKGLILTELDREQDAEDSLRRALYLDRSFIEAHYEIGMQKMRAGNLSAAIKSLETALKLALQGNPDYVLHNAAGMTFSRFAQVLQNEIEMLRSAIRDGKYVAPDNKARHTRKGR